MARKTYYVAKDQAHPLYKTRMLAAGSELALDASAARLYRQLGAVLSETAPAKKLPQLDHDGDGEPGGSPAGEQSTRRRGRRKVAE